MGAHVPRQVGRLREGLTTGGAFVGAVACVGAFVFRQFVGRRAGLATDRALDKVDLAPRCAAPTFAQRRIFTPFSDRRLLPAPLASAHRAITLHLFRRPETVLVKTQKIKLVYNKIKKVEFGKCTGLCCGTFLRKDEGFAYVGSIQPLQDSKVSDSHDMELPSSSHL